MEELNLMLEVSRLLVKVWWAERVGTDSLSQILRLANLWIDKDPNYLMLLALGLFNLRRNKKSLEINESIFYTKYSLQQMIIPIGKQV